jgi:hypothetical protein
MKDDMTACPCRGDSLIGECGFDGQRGVSALVVLGWTREIRVVLLGSQPTSQVGICFHVIDVDA